MGQKIGAKSLSIDRVNGRINWAVTFAAAGLGAGLPRDDLEFRSRAGSAQSEEFIEFITTL
jgi:hypothetical protein